MINLELKQQLRYLLHGCPKHFDSDEPLYIVKDSDPLWEKVLKQLFEKNGESWRIISNDLADTVIYHKSEKLLNINIIKSDYVIQEIKNDIQKNGNSSIDGNLLYLQEIEKILAEIGKNQQNKDIWQKLPLHKTLENECISISGDRIYLENRNFLVPEKLQPLVTIIKYSETLYQEWITEWTPKIALEIILEENQPSQYCSIILECLSQLNDQEKTELIQTLKTEQWLTINNQNQSAINPKNILYISDNQLQNHTDKIVSLNQDKYSDSVLPELIREHSEYKWLTSNLFDHWYAKKIIKFVLEQDNPNNYWEIILDVVQSLNYDIDSDIEKLLQDREWIPVNGSKPKKPGEIIDLAPIKPLEPLKQYLPKLVELSEDTYASPSMILDEMREHEAFNSWLSSFDQSGKKYKYFSTWSQNNIIKHLLKDINYDNQQNQIVFEIIVETLQVWTGIEKQIKTENINLLKTKKWLLDDNHIKFSPNQVLYSISLESDIKHILGYVDAKDYTIACDFGIIQENKFLLNWIIANLFISDQERILNILASLLKNIEEYWIGNFSVKEFPLHHFVQVFQDIDDKNFDFPVWSLAKNLTEEEFKTLLPSVAKQISYEKLVSIFKWISNQYSHRPNKSVVEVYNKYLKLAVDNQYQFSQKILPEIKLLNHYQEWKQSDKLAYEVEGIDYDDIVDDTQLQIIRPYLPEIFQETEDQGIDEQDEEYDTKTENKFSLIQEYFEKWQSHIQHELIGSFIGLLIDDDEKELKNLAHSYLRNRGLPEVRKRLFEYNKNTKTRKFSITIRTAQNTLKSVPSLIGTYFNAKLLSGNKPQHLFEGIINYQTFNLQLIPIDPNEFNSEELSNLLKTSIKILLQKVYQIQPKSLDDTWKDLQESDQISIENARDLILEDSVVYLLRQLGVDKINKEIHDLLTEYRKQRQFHNDKKRRGLDTKVIDDTMQYILKKLRQTLEDEHNFQIRLDILQCVRETINKYGYEPQSIPLEIFQNADDAVVELQQMILKDTLEEDRYQFIIFWTDKELAFMHWGRPINLFRHPNCPKISYKDRGFDSDLEKMLALNISDKPAGEGITGKFGLGFKSVYLLSDKPSIVSGNLGFEVIGGLLPTKLHLTKIEKSQDKLKKHTDLCDGTIISLPIDSKLNINVENIINEFKSWICLLTIFARAIKSIKICGNQTKQITYSWNPIKLLGINNIELGEIEKQAKVICFKLTNDASLLIGIDEKCINILKNVSSIWVTAPTQEKLELGFILNAPFDVTTGRDSLSKLSQKNLTLAENIGFQFGQQLYNLFFTAHNNWTKFQENLGIKISEYDFWHTIWDNLAVSWLSKDSSNTLNIIRLVLGGNCGMGYFITHCSSLPNGLWGDYQKLISPEKTRYIITGILAHQDCFNKVSTWTEFTKRCVDNIVNESVWKNVKLLLGDYFNFQQTQELKLIDVLKWELGEQVRAIPTVAEKLGQLITRKFLSEFYPESLDIGEVLKTIKFQAEDGKFYASYKLLSKYYLRPNLCSENYYEILGIPYNAEIHDIKKAYRSLARKYHPDVNKEANADEIFKKINSAYETLSDSEKRHRYNQTIPTNQTLKTEIELLADFAPYHRLIHYDYTYQSLEFFYICRGNLEEIDIKELLDWAINANTEFQKQAVITYLLQGKMSSQLASLLANYLRQYSGNSWLKDYGHIQDILTLEELKESIHNQSQNQSNHINEPCNIQQSTKQTDNKNQSSQPNNQPRVILEKIYQWWQKEGERHIKKYEQKTYPYGKFPRLSKHDNFKLQEVREQWMILFVLGATYPLGWKGPQQYKNVIVECENLGWWRTFCSPTPQQNSQAWINILDQYFDSKVDQMPYLHWLSRYPVIYLFDRYLEDYIEVFCNIEQVSEEFKLQSFLNPKTSTIFQGSSINLPPLSKVLGIGANFLVRELVRNNIIENSLAHRHCFVPVKRVRKLFVRLGCQLQDEAKANIENSITIHDFLSEHLGKEKANFNNAFDIPFQLLADNPKLRQEIFKQDIDLDDDDMDENQFYDNDEE